MPGTLLYLSYGEDRYQQETMFAILSALRFRRDADFPKIVVYTDKPEIFAWLDVDARELTPYLLDTWMAESAYPFRRKVACLAHLLETDAGKVAFLDGDTFFLRNPAKLLDRIGTGRACLHLREIRLSHRKGTAGKVLDELFDRQVVRDLDGRSIALRSGEAMWNSGVIGVDASDSDKINRAIHLIDEIWTHETRVHTVEQFALGHILAEDQLTEVDDIVFHYWHHRYRAPFLKKLPALLDHARTMPLTEAAEWIYRFRPRAPATYKAASVVRTALHRLGFDHRWTRISA